MNSLARKCIKRAIAHEWGLNPDAITLCQLTPLMNDVPGLISSSWNTVLVEHVPAGMMFGADVLLSGDGRKHPYVTRIRFEGNRVETGAHPTEWGKIK
jgi:hypothetical protein